ncbi:cytochrome P450 [Xanthomonas campestris pv. incanae]|uniref:cytochrome P450 n=1 Tax=Xanthomonas campestris TaxID=339 RepID=UPI0029C21A8B|nr:cytochrome P450 [Xanthomonas campestris]MDX6083415.1 cytochrome P450 [Xanthomonas campestris pv. incanae]MDX6085185.1 cytochrome P450 [Xanthomonas campestris pv. incanae]MDX6141053.1 cytochrome P450 [Xanthomonas campestris pv. incanae]
MQLSDFATPAFRQDPYPMYARLRAAGPLVQISDNGWVSGHYTVVDALLSDRRLGRNYLDSIRVRYGANAAEMPLFQGMSRMFLLLNPPVHTQQRALMTKAFGARQLEALREVAVDTADALLDQHEDRRSCDLLNDFAMPMTISLICRMLGLAVTDVVALGQASSALAKVFDPLMRPEDMAQATAAYTTLEQYFRAIVLQRQDTQEDDLIARLIAAEDHGQRMPVDDIVSNVIMLFTAGHETTANMICNALIALHRHPEQLQLLRDTPTLMPNAVLECMRYDSSVQVAMRSVLQPLQVEGTTLPVGAILYLMLGSANHDAEQFTAPQQLDLRRQQGRALSFGGGVHHCLGNRLALIELETALERLLQRAPALRLPELDNLSWNERANLRGIQALHATW